MPKEEGIYVKPWPAHMSQGVRYNQQADAVNIDNPPSADLATTLANSQAQADGARQLADVQAEASERPLQ